MNGYNKIHDRITSLEVKMKYLEKLLYVIIIGLAGQYGVSIII